MSRTLVIEGIGAYGPGFSCWQDLATLLAQGSAPLDLPANKPPAPALITSAERRRAPQTVKYSVEAASQAVQASGRKAASLTTVFASGMGDVGITDQMCRALTRQPKVISPTIFHNSVHNAPAGYWSIGAGAHAASSSISAFVDTLAVTLLETWSQAAFGRRPVLCVVADMAVQPPMRAICPIPAAAAIALVVSPAELSERSAQIARIELGVEALPQAHAPDPTRYPLGPAMAFLSMVHGVGARDMLLPLGTSTGLRARLS